MIIFLYTTNQHKKWDNFYFEHFPQNSKLTLDRPHRIRRAPVDQVTPRVRRAFVDLGTLLLRRPLSIFIIPPQGLPIPCEKVSDFKDQLCLNANITFNTYMAISMV